MIKIIFRDLPKSKELDLDFKSIKSLSNNASFNPGIKEMGGSKKEYVYQELEMQFESGPVEALFVSGETANYVKKVIKKAL
jgi:hypothetical protein